MYAVWQYTYLLFRTNQGTVLWLTKQGVVNPSLNLPNSHATRDKSIEYTHGNNTASYSYTTTGTGEDEKINADSVKYNYTAVLSSSYTYYDANGQLVSANSYTYTYDNCIR